MSDITISVLIPAYNEKEHLRACVDSIDAQDVGHDVEIIVADDNSDDGTADLLRVLDRSYDSVRVLHHEQNRGCLQACQTAFEAASGDVLLRIDADSTLRDGALDKVVTHIQDGADIVYGKVFVANTDRLHPAASQLGKERGSAPWYGAACVAFRPEVMEDIGGFTAVRQNVELELMNYAESREIEVRKVEDVAIDSMFPETIGEWLPRKFQSGAVYIRETVDSPAEFDLWQLRGPAAWTGIILGLVAWTPLSVAGLVAVTAVHARSADDVADMAGKTRYVLLYPLYMLLGGLARTAGVYRELPLLVRTLRGKYA